MSPRDRPGGATHLARDITPAPADGTRVASGGFHHADMTRAEVARAVPPGSRRIRSQAEAIRSGLSHPDLQTVRPAFRCHLEDWWRIHVNHASWGGRGRPPRGISSPGRSTVCRLARGGMSVTTYKACRAWWVQRGFAAIVRPGWTPMHRAAALAAGQDHNTSQAYVLCVPRRAVIPRPASSSAQPDPGTRPLSQFRRNLDKFPAREGQAPGQGEPGPGHRTSRPAAPRAPALRRGTLAALTDGWWAHITAPFAAAGWTADDLLYAVDHQPDGRQHRTRTDNVRHPAGWLRWRLGLWQQPDGTALASPGQQRAAAAEAHRADLARRRADLGITSRAAAIRAAYGTEVAVAAPQLGWTPPPPGQRRERPLAGWAARRGTVPPLAGKPGPGKGPETPAPP